MRRLGAAFALAFDCRACAQWTITCAVRSDGIPADGALSGGTQGGRCRSPGKTLGAIQCQNKAKDACPSMVESNGES